jgi:hypothetical protein
MSTAIAEKQPSLVAGQLSVTSVVTPSRPAPAKGATLLVGLDLGTNK